MGLQGPFTLFINLRDRNTNLDLHMPLNRPYNHHCILMVTLSFVGNLNAPKN
jgi:hypothetical protein